MNRLLAKAIDLAKRTGDRLIIFERADSERAFVVMSLEEYDRLIAKNSQIAGLTEDELLDKINRDIAIWKSEQELKNWPPARPQSGDSEPRAARPSPTFSLHDIIDFSGQEKTVVRKRWEIPASRKEAAEEVIEEDRQYLEDINF